MSYPDFTDLKNVNREINDDSTYVSDIEQYGLPEVWANISVTKKGDCEDYGIGKLRALLALKWPIEQLRLAKCYTEPFRVVDQITGLERDATMGERYHGVLLVSVGDTDWMLDNRKPHPTESNLSGYKFDLVQVPGTAFFQSVRR